MHIQAAIIIINFNFKNPFGDISACPLFIIVCCKINITYPPALRALHPLVPTRRSRRSAYNKHPLKKETEVINSIYRVIV